MEWFSPFNGLLGNSSSGGGSSGIENYMTSGLEVGTIDATGTKVDNPNRLRTSDFIILEPETYTLFFTSDLRAICFRYTTDGTFIDRTSSYFKQVPISFTAEEGQKFQFAFSTLNGDQELFPSDMKNMVLLKN